VQSSGTPLFSKIAGFQSIEVSSSPRKQTAQRKPYSMPYQMGIITTETKACEARTRNSETETVKHACAIALGDQGRALTHGESSLTSGLLRAAAVLPHLRCKYSTALLLIEHVISSHGYVRFKINEGAPVSVRTACPAVPQKRSMKLHMCVPLESRSSQHVCTLRRFRLEAGGKAMNVFRYRPARGSETWS
jgi:hypothetical protein